MRLIIGNVNAPTNPLLRVASLILGAALLVVALFFGAVLFAFVIGIVVILAAVATVRMWWLGRKLGGPGRAGPDHATYTSMRFGRQRMQSDSGERVIEGEFVEVSEASRDDTPGKRTG